MYACGLNNYGQLGLGEGAKEGRVAEPVEVPIVDGNLIADITGGEHHTLILLKDGQVFGAGRDDDGQIGQASQDELFGHFKRIRELPSVDSIISSSHFNYAKATGQQQYYSWGFGMNYVLGNKKEESVYVPWKISNEDFFGKGVPLKLALGCAHVVFAVNAEGSKETLQESVMKVVKRRPLQKLVKEDVQRLHK